MAADALPSPGPPTVTEGSEAGRKPSAGGENPAGCLASFHGVIMAVPGVLHSERDRHSRKMFVGNSVGQLSRGPLGSPQFLRWGLDVQDRHAWEEAVEFPLQARHLFPELVCSCVCGSVHTEADNNDTHTLWPRGAGVQPSGGVGELQT